VGRNGAGKSNFLSALSFLKDLMRMSATEAAAEKDGWRLIADRTGNGHQIEFGVQAEFTSGQSTWEADYSFALQSEDARLVHIQYEHLNLRDANTGDACEINVENGIFEWSSGAGGKIPKPEFFLGSSDRLALARIGTQPFVDFAELIRAASVCNFSVDEIKRLQELTGAARLNADGGNLARAIEGLKEVDPAAVIRIGQYLRAIVPEVADFWRVEYGDFETVRFRMASANGKPGAEFDARSMSDGTLRVLAALVAAKQIDFPRVPGFIAIEEPETSIHPAAMNALVDALDEATLQTQIIVTTHSPEFLNNPAIKPENVRVVRMVDGKTVIGLVDEASVEIVRQQLSTLGGLEEGNQLEPDLHDLERQRKLSAQMSETAA